ncbi:MAG: hypothetical protein IJ281_03130 [Clostridia bacterium]|nr:hypothetical protein [Clostridia bacterium]
MVNSLLFCKENRHAGSLDARIPYQLSLDRSFSYICADSQKREQFLSVISDWTDDAETISYRREILSDFYSNPSLLAEMLSLSGRWEELRLSHKSGDREGYRLRAERNTSPIAAKNILQAQALACKRALLFIKAYGEMLSAYDLHSRGLTAFRDACREVYEHPEFPHLITFCAQYENFSASGFLDFKFTLHEDGRIARYEWINHRYIHVSDPDIRKSGFSLFKKTAEVVHPCVRVYPPADGFFDNLAVGALAELSRIFSSVFEQIAARLGNLCADLDFYDTACQYIHTLEAKKIPYCYPGFSADNSMRIHKLYDLYLLMTKASPSEVVPNDVEMTAESGGILVFGDNGSGKTVYLRSVGTMQVLAQAGLPVPCERAEIPLFSQIGAQFSEAEKEFLEGNEAGRFEQEVRELAGMVDTLQEGALVFLNETFQSTAYAEGAEGLYHLLKHFSASGIRWILVSHLRQLESMFSHGDATILHMAEGYTLQSGTV